MFYNAAAVNVPCTYKLKCLDGKQFYVTGRHLALGTLGASLGHDLGGLSSTLGLG